MPLAVTANPPLSMVLPPEVALFDKTFVAELVLKVGALGGKV